MKSAEEFQALSRKDCYGLVRELFHLEEDALPIEVEGACYDAAGAIATILYPDFDLKRVSKRDIFLVVMLTSGADRDQVKPYLSKIHRYVKSYFASKM